MIAEQREELSVLREKNEAHAAEVEALRTEREDLSNKLSATVEQHQRATKLQQQHAAELKVETFRWRPCGFAHCSFTTLAILCSALFRKVSKVKSVRVIMMLSVHQRQVDQVEPCRVNPRRSQLWRQAKHHLQLAALDFPMSSR